MARKTTPSKTAAVRTTAGRATTASKTTVRRAVKEQEAEGPAVQPNQPKVLGKRELIDRVVESSGIKKKAAKPVVEAMLKELGDALSQGETLNLQPFGKGIIKNRKELENAEVIELRLRRSKQARIAAGGAPKDPLAEAAE